MERKTDASSLDASISDVELSDIGLDLNPSSFRVVSTSPAAATKMVSRTGMISVILNKSALLESIVLTLADESDDAVAGTVAFDEMTKTIAFAPAESLDMNVQYTARLSGGTKDVDGNLLGGDFEWTFETGDGKWVGGKLLETNNVGSANAPSVAFDDEGIAIAVWSQSDDQDLFSVWYNRFDGTNWTGTDLVEGEVVLSAHSPIVDFDSKGNAIVLWSQQEKGMLLFPFRTDIWASHFDSNWKKAIRISDDNERYKGSFALSVDGLGHTSALIVPLAPPLGLQFNATTITDFNGSSWGEPFAAVSSGLINGGGVFVATEAKTATSEKGEILGVWGYQFTGGGSTSETRNIQSRFFNGTDWEEPILIESDDAGDAGSPQVEFDNKGNAIAVWQQSDGTRSNIWANRFDGTNWGNAERIEREDKGDAEKPQIAFDDNGNAIVVWIQSDGVNKDLWANRFDGTRWEEARLIESENEEVSNPQLAIDNRGHAIVVWVQNENIWSNRFTANDNTWGSAQLLETDDTGPAKEPAIDIDSNGNAFVVWSQSDGTRSNIWVNRFE